MIGGSDKRLRYRFVSATDREVITRACKILERRSRTRGGVYVVLNGALDERASIRRVLRWEWPVLYVGGSSDLKTRTLHLASGFLGTNHRHCFVQLHWRDLGLEPAPERLALLLLPFNPHHCLETFILRAHREKWGAFPVGNRRRAARSSARNQEPPVEVTADLLLNRQQRS